MCAADLDAELRSADGFAEILHLIPATRPLAREQELARIVRWMNDGARLVTITGPAGVGKSRLAMYVVSQMAREPDVHIFVVPLASLGEASEMPATLMRAFKLAESAEPAVQRIVQYLASLGAVTLVLDNLEHLAGASDLVDRLVQGAPGLRVLATSRVALGSRTERVFDLRPLPVPAEGAGHDELLDSPAVQLVLDRTGSSPAAITAADLPVVGRICRSVEGLPLALELAAGQILRSGLADLARRVESGSGQLDLIGVSDDPRLQSLRTTIAISWRSLGKDAQRTFACLAVFTGGFDMEMANALINGPHLALGRSPYDLADVDRHHHFRDGKPALPDVVAQIDVESIVDELVRMHLVTVRSSRDGSQRYGMAEAIRAFGLERLDERTDADQIRTAHAVTMLLVCWDAAAGQWLSLESEVYRARFANDLANLHAGLNWAASDRCQNGYLATGLATTAWFQLQLNGSVSEAREWLDRGTSLECRVPWMRGQAMHGVAYTAWIQGDLDRAKIACAEVLAADLEPQYLGIRAFALFIRSLVAWREGDVPAMVEYLLTAKPLFAEAGEFNGIGMCNLALGTITRLNKQFDEARALLRESFDVNIEAGFLWGAATAQLFSGQTEHDAGDAVAAIPFLADGIDRYARLGDVFGTGATIATFAELASERGEDVRAARLLGAAFGMIDHAGMIFPPADAERYQALAARLMLIVGPEQFAIGRSWPIERARSEALALADDILANRVPGPVNDPLALLLTAEQLDAVNLRVAGRSVPEVAEHLGYSVSAAYARLARARERLDVHSDEELIVKVMELRNGHGSH